MEPQPNQHSQPDLTEKKSPENAPLIWQELGANARQGLKMDVPKFFRDLHDLDLTGELDKRPAWQQTLLVAGQDILLWTRAYEATEDSVGRYERALQNLSLPQPEREQLRQDIINKLRIAHLLGLDRDSQNPDYQLDSEQIRAWQADSRFQSLADIAASAPSLEPAVAEPQPAPEAPVTINTVTENAEMTPDQLLSLIQQTEADVLNSFGLTERVEALNGIMAGDFTYGQVAGSGTFDHLVDEVNLLIAQIRQKEANGQPSRMLHEIDRLAHLLPRDRQLSDVESKGAANTLIALARTAYQQIAQLVIERNNNMATMRMHNSPDIINRRLLDRAIEAVRPNFLSQLSKAIQQRFEEDRERLKDLLSLAYETSINARGILSDAVVNQILEQMPNLDPEEVLKIPQQTDNDPFFSINDIRTSLFHTRHQHIREEEQQEYAATQASEQQAEAPAVIIDYSNIESLRNLEKRESELYNRIMKIGQVTLTVNNAGRQLTNWNKAEASATITDKNNREVMTKLEEQTVQLQAGNDPFLNKSRAAYLDQLVENGVFERFSIQPITIEIKAMQTQQRGTKTESSWRGLVKKQVPDYKQVEVTIGHTSLMAQEIFGVGEPNEPLVSIAYSASELGGTDAARPGKFRDFKELKTENPETGPNKGRRGADAGFGIAVPLSVAQEFVSLLKLDPALGRKYMDSFVENCGDQAFIDVDYFGDPDIQGSGFSRPPYEDWDEWTIKNGGLPGIEIKDFINNPETEKPRQETTFNPYDVINFTINDFDNSYVGMPQTSAR